MAPFCFRALESKTDAVFDAGQRCFVKKSNTNFKYTGLHTRMSRRFGCNIDASLLPLPSRTLTMSKLVKNRFLSLTTDDVLLKICDDLVPRIRKFTPEMGSRIHDRIQRFVQMTPEARLDDREWCTAVVRHNRVVELSTCVEGIRGKPYLEDSDRQKLKTVFGISHSEIDISTPQKAHGTFKELIKKYRIVPFKETSLFAEDRMVISAVGLVMSELYSEIRAEVSICHEPSRTATSVDLLGVRKSDGALLVVEIKVGMDVRRKGQGGPLRNLPEHFGPANRPAGTPVSNTQVNHALVQLGCTIGMLVDPQTYGWKGKVDAGVLVVNNNAGAQWKRLKGGERVVGIPPE